ncbi:hypothetical protein Q5P01_008572 [Channa striata]|uniref:Uncharacterized protein n=1 Tax=Channa striata TaxID=64152 RepID=A0AA88N708_CHASR|nr:hypothetical protein Q5P01_008572 [Channa striata]
MLCVLLLSVFLGTRANTSGAKEGARRLAIAAESFPRAFTCKFAPLLPLCSHNGAQQIIVSSLRDGFHPRALWMWKEAGLYSYVDLSAAATEPDCASSIMEEGKQPRPFSICANVREKDRFSGINSSRETPSGTNVISGASNQTAHEEEKEDEEHRGRRKASVNVLGCVTGEGGGVEEIQSISPSSVF